MAAQFIGRFAGVTSGTSAKTLVQIVPGSNVTATVIEYRFSFNSATSADVPVLCEILRQTTAGTSSSLTLAALKESVSKAAVATALQTFTVEPTAGTILYSDYVTPVGGLYVIQFPLGREPDALTNRIGLRVTAPQTETVSGSITIEE